MSEMSYHQHRRGVRNENLGWVFVLPWVIGFLGLTILPLLVSLWLSFTEWNGFGGISSAEFVGLQNYKNLFDISTKYGESFYAALQNTLIYTVMAICINLVVGISVAWAVVKNNKVNSILRMVIYLPTLTISTAFAIMMDTIIGTKTQSLINRLMLMANGTTQAWLATPGQAIWVMVMLCFWGIGGAMLTYFSGMKQIDENIYDAAKIDGANRFRQFFSITIPAISPTLYFLLAMGLLNGLQTFDIAKIFAQKTSGYVTGSAGPSDAGLTTVFHIYNTMNNPGTGGMPVASIMSLILFVVITLVLALNKRISKLWVSYD